METVSIAEVDEGPVHGFYYEYNAGYDALVPGPLDFVYGADALSSLRSKQLPFLSLAEYHARPTAVRSLKTTRF
ncbi:MAG: hypothetical protein ACLR1V_16185 [Coprococcus sp.]